jgi:rhamnosyltransferase subunit B
MHSGSAPNLHFVLLGIGSMGDVQPLHILAGEIARRGHHVTFVALPGFEKRPEDSFEVIFAPSSLSPELGPPAGKSSGAGKTWLGRSVSRWRAAEPLITRRAIWVHNFIVETHVPGRTVVLGRSGLFGARIAREHLDIKLVTLHHTPSSLRSRYESILLPIPEGRNLVLRSGRAVFWRTMDFFVGRLLCPALEEIRQPYGLPRIRRLFDRWAFSPDMNLGLFPGWYAEPQKDWPKNAVLSGFPIPKTVLDEALPDALQRFLTTGAPVVVFTRGSHGSAGAEFFQAACLAAKAGGFRALLLGASSEQVPEDADEGVLAVKYAPLRAILPKVRVLVHHGGVGTCALAYRAGVPQVIVPGVGDQWEQAKRVARLGCGRFVTPRGFNVKSCVRSVTALLSDPGVARRCAELASRCSREDGIGQAAKHAEFVASAGGRLPGSYAQAAG